jgi:N-acetylneuraminic acid mutarotase
MRYSPLGAAHRVPFLVWLAAAVVLPACNDEISAPPAATLAPLLDISTTNPGTWIERARLLGCCGRYAMSGAVIRNSAGQDIMYVVGGFNEMTRLRRMDAYNVATNTWTQRADLPEKLAYSTAAAIGGKLYVVGGHNGTSTKTLYVYTPATNSWTRRADPPVPMFSGLAVVISDRLYVLTSMEEQTQLLYRYNPVTNKWVRLADPPRSHWHGAGSVINGKLYVAWGASITVDVYDPVTNLWKLKHIMERDDWIPYFPYGRNELRRAQAVTFNNQLYLIGGMYRNALGNWDISKFVFAYNPVSDQWSKKADLLTPRVWHVVGKGKNSAGALRIIATGGANNSALTDRTEAFKP